MIIIVNLLLKYTSQQYLKGNSRQGLRQDLEIWCSKLAIVNFWGVLFFKGDHKILVYVLHWKNFNYMLQN